MGDVWSVQDAKAKLSEVLRRARTDGPQTIGSVHPCVVVSQEEWERLRPSLSEWLLAQPPLGEPIPIPDRNDPPRPIPFADES